MRLLHVVASPRAAESTTLRISDAFLQSLRQVRPDLEIETVDLFTAGLPTMAGQPLDTKYGLLKGRPVEPAAAVAWRGVEDFINQFTNADLCLISSPMWNFSIPYALKHYIDTIVQPGYLFTYDSAGVPVGLCADKRLVCVTSRGGDYSAGSPMHGYDLQESYLRTIFTFIGITDMHFVHVQPVDLDPAQAAAAIDVGVEMARRLAHQISLADPAVVA